jgi:transmembrane sensor
LEDGISRHLAALQRNVPREDSPAPRRRWIFVATAAVLVLGIGLAVGWQQWPYFMPAQVAYQASSAVSPVVLRDGTQILLMPSSRLRISGRHQEKVELQGGAYFDVPHDPNRSLTVKVGDYDVHDIGTRFELFGAAHLLKVAVAEGSVAIELPGTRQAALPVVAGQQVLIANNPPVAEYASIAVDGIGAWHSGQLEFRNEPLRLVAEQVALVANVVVTVDSSIADRRFSGVLVVGDGSQLVTRLAEIMGLAVQPVGDAVRLSAVGANQ